MRTVPLYGEKAAGRIALVDDEDFGLVMQYRWNVAESCKPGCRPVGPYAIANVKRGGKYKSTRMHQLITGWPQTDHIDHDGLNNQRSNLRPATGNQNQANQRRHLVSSSRFKGVTWYGPASKWTAAITDRGHRTYLGRFASEEEAARVYDAAAREAWGEYAHLNFPDLPPLVRLPDLCLVCGDPIRSDLRAGTKFCCGACRREDSRAREAVVRRERHGWRKRADSRY